LAHKVRDLEAEVKALKAAEAKARQAQMRAEVERDAARRALGESLSKLRGLGFGSVAEARNHITQLETELTAELDKAASSMKVLE
jgi:hypothetical protein